MKKTLLLTIIAMIGFCFTTNAGVKKEIQQESKFKSDVTAQFKALTGTQDDASPLPDPAKKKKRKKGRSGGSSFSQGAIIFSLGYGFPNLNKSIFNAFKAYENYKVTGFGPLHFKFEYGISDNIGLGLSVNMVSSKVQWDVMDIWSSSTYVYQEGYKFSAMAFNVRFNYHFITDGPIDMYAGIGLGYNNSKSTYFNNDTTASGSVDIPTLAALIPLGLEFTMGVRYYFSPNIGIYAELGAAKSIVQGGVAIKF